MEAKFGLRVRDSKPSDTSSRENSDPMDVGAVNSLSRQAKGKGHRVRVMGVLSAVEHIFNETAMHAKAHASNRLTKANRASHESKSEGKGKSKENKRKIQKKVQRNQRCDPRCQRLPQK